MRNKTENANPFDYDPFDLVSIAKAMVAHLQAGTIKAWHYTPIPGYEVEKITPWTTPENATVSDLYVFSARANAIRVENDEAGLLFNCIVDAIHFPNGITKRGSYVFAFDLWWEPSELMKIIGSVCDAVSTPIFKNLLAEQIYKKMNA